MPAFQIHKDASRIDTGADGKHVLVLSVSLFGGTNKPHNRSEKHSAQYPHTTREFTFAADATRAEIADVLQREAEAWEATVMEQRQRAKAIDDL